MAPGGGSCATDQDELRNDDGNNRVGLFFMPLKFAVELREVARFYTTSEALKASLAWNFKAL
jgi:hypothetical protein